MFESYSKTAVMKKSIIFFLVIGVLTAHSQSNPDSLQQNYRSVIFKTSIYNQTTKIATGYLSELTDSTALLTSNKRYYLTSTLPRTDLKEIPVNDISSIYVKDTRNAGKGMIIGAVIGSCLGLIVSGSGGSNSYIKASNAKPAMIFFTAGIGSIIGALIGSSSKIFTINRSRENLGTLQNTLMGTLQKKSK
jgi:hypothetical protein